MQQFKIDFWKEEGKDILFKALNKEEIAIVIEKISTKLNINLATIVKDDILSFFLKQLPNSIPIEGINTEYGAKKIFNILNLPIFSSVYLIWQSNEIDCLLTADFIKYWYDIWYDIADDAVLIYSVDNSFLFLVTHFEIVFYLV